MRLCDCEWLRMRAAQPQSITQSELSAVPRCVVHCLVLKIYGRNVLPQTFCATISRPKSCQRGSNSFFLTECEEKKVLLEEEPQINFIIQMSILADRLTQRAQC